jgi:hypothetical protein
VFFLGRRKYRLSGKDGLADLARFTPCFSVFRPILFPSFRRTL